jgi:hypothetical protein
MIGVPDPNQHSGMGRFQHFKQECELFALNVQGFQRG